MLQKIMSSADAAINVGIKLISLAIVLQVVFSDVPFLGGGDVIGTLIGIEGNSLIMAWSDCSQHF